MSGLAFDLSTPGARRACLLFHVRRGLLVKEAAWLARIPVRRVEDYRRRTPGFAAALDEAKRAGRGVAVWRGEPLFAVDKADAFLGLVRAGVTPGQAARRLGLYNSHAVHWRRRVAGFDASYAEAKVVGRRARLDPRIGALVAALDAGASMGAACRAAGVWHTTILRWRAAGRREWELLAPHYRRAEQPPLEGQAA